MRCDSQGELYPINPIITNLANSPFALAALAPSLWHDRLGHPRAPVFNSLRLNKFECTKLPSDHVCHSCSLGKHVQLLLFLLIHALLCHLILSIVIFGHHLF